MFSTLSLPHKSIALHGSLRKQTFVFWPACLQFVSIASLALKDSVAPLLRAQYAVLCVHHS